MADPHKSVSGFNIFENAFSGCFVPCVQFQYFEEKTIHFKIKIKKNVLLFLTLFIDIAI